MTDYPLEPRLEALIGIRCWWWYERLLDQLRLKVLTIGGGEPVTGVNRTAAPVSPLRDSTYYGKIQMHSKLYA
jgi:hypothetical protein